MDPEEFAPKKEDFVDDLAKVMGLEKNEIDGMEIVFSPKTRPSA